MIVRHTSRLATPVRMPAVPPGGRTQTRSLGGEGDRRGEAETQARLIQVVGMIALIAMTVCFGGVLLRVAQLQMAPTPDLAEHIEDRVMARKELGPRGDLLDRRGRLLAGTSVGRRVFVDPTLFPEPYDANVVRLAQAIGIEPMVVGERVLSRIEENKRRLAEGRRPVRYVSLGGILDAWAVEQVQKLNLAGVAMEDRSVRDTPAGDVSAALVGKVGVDHDGLLGAERSFDKALDSSDGKLEYVHDARGRALWIEAGGYVSPQRGRDLRLSVDLALQEIASEELARGCDEADAAGGRAIVFDPATGEVLAMVNHYRDVPGLRTPKPRGTRKEDADPSSGVRFAVIPADPARLIHPAMGRNRCVEDAYEPGSTFKPYMWSTVTELGLAKPEETIDTGNGRWHTAYGRLLEDVVELSKQTWSEVLVNSSNIGMVKVCERLSFKQAHDAITRFGFGRRTGIDLPGESTGMVTSLRNWTKYTQTSVSMGYEVAVTPVQMVRAFSAFARDGEHAGTMPHIRLVASEPGIAPDEASPVRAVAPWAAQLARGSMKHVGENLDARLIRGKKLDNPPKYDMFGKSGTAKVARPDGRGYYERQYRVSFIAGAPFDRPKIVVLVVIDDPGPERIRTRTHYGSYVAGPIVRRIVERSLAYMGVPPNVAPPAPVAQAKDKKPTAVASNPD